MPTGFLRGSLKPVSVGVEIPRPVIVTTLTILVVSIAVTSAIRVIVAIRVVIGELSIRLAVPALKALAVVSSAELVTNRAGRMESEMRQGVAPTCDQSVIDASSLFELLPAAVYSAVAVTVTPLPVLGEGASAARG